MAERTATTNKVRVALEIREAIAEHRKGKPISFQRWRRALPIPASPDAETGQQQ